jgi:protein SCO1/2
MGIRKTFFLFVFGVCGFACRPVADPVASVGVDQKSVLPRLAKHWELPHFELVDQNGMPFLSSVMKGKVWVVDFFYSSCPGPCPALTSQLSSVHRDFEGEAGVGFLSISSDPEKDTPEVLRAYAGKFHADERWLFLTGSKPRIYELANTGFKLSLKEMADSPEPISHSTRLCLVDQQGWVRGFYEGVGEESSSAGKRLREDARALLNEAGALKN